jgi:hypothetical protein
MIHRTDPRDVSKMVTVYPIHDVEGPASWLGRCPASQFIVPKLTQRAKQHLAESLAAYERRLAENIRLARMTAATARARAELDPLLPPGQRKLGAVLGEDPFGNVIDLRTGDYVEPRPGARVGRRTHRPNDDYFPGRPGDPPEPGRGEKPGGSVPPGVDGESLGKGEK